MKLLQLALHLSKKIPLKQDWMFYLATTSLNLNSNLTIDLETLNKHYQEVTAYNLEADPQHQESHRQGVAFCYEYLEKILQTQGTIELKSYQLHNLRKEEIREILVLFSSITRYVVIPNVDLGFIDTAHLRDLSDLFSKLHYCDVKFKYQFDVGTWEVSQVENMDRLFAYCNIKVVGYGKWNLASLKSAVEMFRDNRLLCEAIKLDLRQINGKALHNIFFNSRYLLDGNLEQIFVNSRGTRILHELPSMLTYYNQASEPKVFSNLKRNYAWLEEHIRARV
ncbi:BspA family leucine-rich repeat surface protein [Psittacicella gerlachiana]|uniref:Uncharacterized protein n=1 Tax=Psittacicella gerlachiana TaxID=2028574 RepID=A0A3A1YHV7_9GAMM|nr:BspA family leucine-rich repeat surface protein [Psittacicella gerlachiana]RIY36839.1 hypothetical protein CKF59_02170 [Psittacicella gerlachiana]